METIFRIFETENPMPLVFDSPHSGRVYPADFDFSCARGELKKAEDRFVEELFANAPSFGGTLLCALFPRSYLDVNRAIDDIDPNILAAPWPYGAISPSARSDAGIGLVRRLVRPGLPVYSRLLSPQEIFCRIERYYKPYHAQLEKLLNASHYNFGQVWHVNCHSMPSSSARPRHAPFLDGNRPGQADFVLGDRDGTTCDLSFTHGLRDFLRGLGYRVSINDPFKGAELIERYSNPPRGRHSLQIEINKALFMDEARNEKSKDFAALKSDIDRLIGFCAEFVQSRLVSLAAD